MSMVKNSMRSIAVVTGELVFLALVVVVCGASSTAERDPRWAVPLVGLPNLAQIEPGLYRGAQPKPAGFASLRAMRVKTIVNLRQRPSDPDEIQKAGLPDNAFKIVEIPMTASRPNIADVAAFLKIAVDRAKWPLFFHCKHGADRTGVMAASYRVVVQCWKAEDANAEMTSRDFGFHAVFRRVLTEFIKEVENNAPKLRQTLDIKSCPERPPASLGLQIGCSM